MNWASSTNTGKSRALNEDSFVALPGLWVVADGMGGHAAGDVASRMAVDAVVEAFDGPPISIGELADGVERANEVVRGAAAARFIEMMGTTLVGVAIVDNGGQDTLVVFNVGDSRCYGITSGAEVRQLTNDHSQVQELVSAGAISPAEALTHPERNIVTRAIGVSDTVRADYLVIPRGEYRRLVVCTDGVWSEIAPETFDAVVGGVGGPDATVEELVEAVLEGRARDNLTVLVLDIEWVHATDDDADDVDATGPRRMEQMPPDFSLDPVVDDVPLSERVVDADEAGPVELIKGVPGV